MSLSLHSAAGRFVAARDDDPTPSCGLAGCRTSDDSECRAPAAETECSVSRTCEMVDSRECSRDSRWFCCWSTLLRPPWLSSRRRGVSWKTTILLLSSVAAAPVSMLTVISSSASAGQVHFCRNRAHVAQDGRSPEHLLFLRRHGSQAWRVRLSTGRGVRSGECWSSLLLALSISRCQGVLESEPGYQRPDSCRFVAAGPLRDRQTWWPEQNVCARSRKREQEAEAEAEAELAQDKMETHSRRRGRQRDETDNITTSTLVSVALRLLSSSFMQFREWHEISHAACLVVCVRVCF